jgi:glucose-1-phosphate thymidylyltransferase
MKAILLAGGKGTRLWPSTIVTNKHFLGIYDKPVIYYSLSTIMLAGIKDVLLISDINSLNSYKKLFGSGEHLGMQIQYAEQETPDGIPQALLIGRDFLQGDDPLLVLGDNVMYGPEVGRNLENYSVSGVARILTKSVADPQAFGVATYDSKGNITDLSEKPENPISTEAIIGVYFLTNESCEIATTLKKSRRGEYEIVDLLKVYQNKGELKGNRLPKGTVWLDTGTVEDFSLASDYVRVVQSRQSELICSPEQIALQSGWISPSDFKLLLKGMPSNTYKKQLTKLLDTY